LKKPQLFVVIFATILFLATFFFVPRTKKKVEMASASNTISSEISSESLINGAKNSLTASQKISLLSIENQLVNSKLSVDSLRVFTHLAQFWADSAQRLEPYLYYTYRAALLENSEKSLTFAAQQLIDNLTTPEAPPAMLNWMASNAKVLLEKALVLNPNNDSAKINLGACYLFGNISDNPMQGILKVKEVVDKNPQNLYGLFILGLGGKKSGQYPKAIERFTTILKVDPSNLEAMVNLAECYELTDQKEMAIDWYNKLKTYLKNPAAKEAIDKRIKDLKK